LKGDGNLAHLCPGTMSKIHQSPLQPSHSLPPPPPPTPTPSGGERGESEIQTAAVDIRICRYFHTRSRDRPRMCGSFLSLLSVPTHGPEFLMAPVTISLRSRKKACHISHSELVGARHGQKMWRNQSRVEKNGREVLPLAIYCFVWITGCPHVYVHSRTQFRYVNVFCVLGVSKVQPPAAHNAKQQS
jgi:hypothetical protein